MNTTGRTTECNGTTGIGATVIRTAISKKRKRSERLKLAGRQWAGSFRLIFPRLLFATRMAGVSQGGSKESRSPSSASCFRSQRGKPA